MLERLLQSRPSDIPLWALFLIAIVVLVPTIYLQYKAVQWSDRAIDAAGQTASAVRRRASDLSARGMAGARPIVVGILVVAASIMGVGLVLALIGAAASFWRRLLF